MHVALARQWSSFGAAVKSLNNSREAEGLVKSKTLELRHNGIRSCSWPFPVKAKPYLEATFRQFTTPELVNSAWDFATAGHFDRLVCSVSHGS